jgi:FlaA1/EpsC-like NDP-sugar epimerase
VTIVMATYQGERFLNEQLDSIAAQTHRNWRLCVSDDVKIVDLAERMIRLSGLEPGRDVEIKFIGIRPGERLHEILFAREEPTAPIGIEGIVAAQPTSPSLEVMRGWLAALEQGLARGERSAIYGILRDAVPDFGGQAA